MIFGTSDKIGVMSLTTSDSHLFLIQLGDVSSSIGKIFLTRLDWKFCFEKYLNEKVPHWQLLHKILKCTSFEDSWGTFFLINLGNYSFFSNWEWKRWLCYRDNNRDHREKKTVQEHQLVPITARISSYRRRAKTDPETQMFTCSVKIDAAINTEIYK